jgi:hypothetical protein
MLGSVALLHVRFAELHYVCDCARTAQGGRSTSLRAAPRTFLPGERDWPGTSGWLWGRRAAWLRSWLRHRLRRGARRWRGHACRSRGRLGGARRRGCGCGRAWDTGRRGHRCSCRARRLCRWRRLGRGACSCGRRRSLSFTHAATAIARMPIRLIPGCDDAAALRGATLHVSSGAHIEGGLRKRGTYEADLSCLSDLTMAEQRSMRTVCSSSAEALTHTAAASAERRRQRTIPSKMSTHSSARQGSRGPRNTYASSSCSRRPPHV